MSPERQPQSYQTNGYKK